MKTHLYCTLLALAFFPLFANAAVWPNTREWSEQEELRYSQWVENGYPPETFWKTGTYPNIETDCADAAYAMRMIYSYQNGLPFAFKDSGTLVTNDSDRFDRISDPKNRFVAFMKYVMGATSSTSMANDTYPIAITRESLTAGTIYLATGTHVYQVVGVKDGGTTLIQYSTVPRDVRVMSRVEMFPNYIPGDLKIKGRPYIDGYRRFKTPQMYKMNESSLPHYSLEQFEKAKELGEDISSFQDWVQSRLAIRSETAHERLQRSLLLVCYSSWDRAEVVAQALFEHRMKVRTQGPDACFNALEYDELSTPTRDHRLVEYFKQLHSLPSVPGWDNYRGEMKEMIEQITGIRRTEQMEKRLMEWCDVDRQVGGPMRPMSLSELHDLALAGKLVSDPHANREQRWGLDPFTPVCKQY